MRVVIPVSLDDQKDADIIEWLNRHQNKSAAIRDALRSNLADGITLADIYQEIKALKSRSFVAIADEPGQGLAEAELNLDKLLGP